ncbi:hypothetical protein ABZ446_45445 [Streptomyces sp. NPDC005813]|uniref:hypothetical protein n=1 Tax=Streptomyces sp. NPDC005813 TaxID=3155592 RepID=UPI0034049FF8
MFQEAPIYRQLITERGDIPAQVRDEADRIRRDLQRVMPQLHGPASPVAERVWPDELASRALSPGLPSR